MGPEGAEEVPAQPRLRDHRTRGKRIKQRTLAEIEAIDAGRVLPPP
jgi:hypothetical protein